MANRLARELSPYLLQHKDNPVDWYPWGEEAFARARTDDRPIFLSVGYSTCHWCHVMAHESFESAQVAEVLNRSFVPVKVDREERPDVDRVYMTFVQATTGSGGWPMSVWLTPALQPFYGGTYYPPTSRWGRPGFIDVLLEIARVWRDEREKVVQSAATMLERLRTLDAATGVRVPGPDVLTRTVQEFAASFDAEHGGFGEAPKFPRPSELLFLLREHARTGAPAPRDMAVATLRAMARGGMRDHLGGGFHRYSVDAEWRVPHFEKMLYDQAQLALACLEGAQASGDAFLGAVAIDTLEYVLRDLGHPAGGFASAEDADSIPPESAGAPGAHPVEGAFYAWHDAEIADALGAEADVFRIRYGILPGGNVPFDPHGEFAGKNLLYTASGIDAVAARASLTADAVRGSLERSRARLLARRATRPRPHLDDKVITAWNGLTIAALARASRMARGHPEDQGVDARMLDAAQRAADFVRSHLWRAGDARLLRRFRDGASGIEGYAEDYAYLVFGLLELFQSDGDPAWLEWALVLQRRMDDLFWDSRDGGWYSTTGEDDTVLLRQKEEYDGAEPSASAVGVLNLLTIAHLVEPDHASTRGAWPRDLASRIDATLAAFAGRASSSGRAIPMLLAALSSYHAGVSQLAIAGDPGDGETRTLWRAAAERYVPFTVTVPIVPRHGDALAGLLPWTRAMWARDGGPAAYLCREFACDVPATTAAALAAQLRHLGAETRET